MGAIKSGRFYILFSVLLIKAESYSASKASSTSDIEKIHKDIHASIKYTLDLKQPIPGTPNQDYPVYSKVPNTKFSCIGKQEGYYADTESRCQVFRICANTATSSQGFAFLCPNGTLFSQKDLVCNWYRNVNCNDSKLYYNNNVKVGTESDIMKTIRRMIEYPIKMLKDEYTHSHSVIMNNIKMQDVLIAGFDKLKNKRNDFLINNATKPENFTKNFNSFEKLHESNGSFSLINNLGEFKPDINLNYKVQHDTNTIYFSEKEKINGIHLALKINNLAETDIKNNDSENIKQTFRFLSQEFSNKNVLNITEYKFTNIEQPGQASSMAIEGSHTPINGEMNNGETLVKEIYNFTIKTTVTPNVIRISGNYSVSDVKDPKINENLKYLQKYSSNLLISGIVQTYVDPEPYENNTLNKNKHFKNVYTRSFQQKFKTTTPLLPTITKTLNPRPNFKQRVANRLTSLSSISPSSKKSFTVGSFPTLISDDQTSIDKENKHIIKTQIKIKNATNMAHQPTWESVRKTLMRYQIPNADLTLKHKYIFNTTKSYLQSTTTIHDEEDFRWESKIKSPILNSFEQNIKQKPNERITQNSFIRNIVNNTMRGFSNDFYNNKEGSLKNIVQSQADNITSSKSFQHLNNKTSVIAGARENAHNFFKKTNFKQRDESQKNYISLEEFLSRKFGARKGSSMNIITQQPYYNFEISQNNISSYGHSNDGNINDNVVRPNGIFHSSDNEQDSMDYHHLSLNPATIDYTPQEVTAPSHPEVNSYENPSVKFTIFPRFKSGGNLQLSP